MTGQILRNCLISLGVAGWMGNSDQLDHSITVGVESLLGSLSTIFGSLPRLSPGILWISVSWNVNVNPFALRVPSETGSSPCMAEPLLFLPYRIEPNGVRQNRCLLLQCNR